MSESDIRYKRLGYVWLNVTDLDRSRRFYTEIVGLALVGEDDGHVFLRCSDRHHDIILSQHREAGLKEIGWQMENARALEALRERFGADGIRTVSLSPSECETMRTDDGFWMTEGHTGARMRFYCHMLAMRAPHLDAVDLIAKMAAGDLAWGLMWLWTKRCTVLIVLWTMRRMVRARIYPVRRTVRM